ncbi:MAG: molecular chaperone DnaJ [archaeon]
MSKDYYATLGLSKHATQEEIKAAYKKLAKQYHPDVNKDHTATEKFKEINEAMSVLSDPKKREQYDRFGSDSFRHNQQGFDNFDFNDVFEQFFGEDMGGFGFNFSQRQRRGKDIVHDVTLDLEETVTGKKETLSIRKTEHCSHCNGEGGTGLKQCKACHGRGVRAVTHRTPFGLVQTTGTCSDCHGKGEIADEECSHCNGEGVQHTTKKIEVEIPPGVSDDTRVRLAGQGNEMRGGPAGDLYIRMHIREHPLFEREEDDVYIEAPISYYQAVMGGEIDVPTLDGKATLKIPAGTQPGTILRMRGKGIPHLHHTGRGDQNVRITINVPDKVSKKQKELLVELNKLSSEKNIFQKIRGVFK